MKLTQYNFSQTQYILETKEKLQIYLHHTAGNANPFSVYDGWGNSDERVATCVVIGGNPKNNNEWEDGEVVQGFSSRYWAYHLGLKESVFDKFNLPYKSLDKISIGIEICNWGQLTQIDGKFYNYLDREVDPDDVIELEEPHRGFRFYHAYTDAQIDAVRELLIAWNEKYHIPITYNPDIFDVTPRALKGNEGVFTHNSVRFDKTDVSPQPKLIEMLKSL